MPSLQDFLRMRGMMPPPIRPRNRLEEFGSDTNGISGQGPMFDEEQMPPEIRPPMQQSPGMGGGMPPPVPRRQMSMDTPRGPVMDALRNDMNTGTGQEPGWSTRPPEPEPPMESDRGMPPEGQRQATQVDFPPQARAPQQGAGPMTSRAMDALSSDQYAPPPKPPSLWRQILGGVASLTPAAGFSDLIANGPKRIHERQLRHDQQERVIPNLVTGAKIEQDARRLDQTDQFRHDTLAERERAERERQLDRQDKEGREQQEEIGAFTKSGGEFMSDAPTPFKFDPPALRSPMPPQIGSGDLQGPPLPPEMMPLPPRPLKLAPIEGSMPAMPREGYQRVPGAKYDPKGQMRIAPTPAEIARQKEAAKQESWLPTPAFIKERFPEVGDKVPEQVLRTYVSAIEADGRAAADRQLRMYLAEQSNAVRLAGQASTRAIAEISRGNTQSNQQNSRINQIASQFDNEPIVKNFNTIAEAKQFVDSLATGKDGTSTDDQGLIYAFAKAMDPGSVVREGEYATVQKYSQAWADRFGFKVQNILSNSPFLTDKARQMMKETIAKKLAASKQQYDNVYKEYGRRIEKQAGVQNGHEYLTDYSKASTGPSSAPSGKERTDIPANIASGIAEGQTRTVNAPDGKTITLTKRGGKIYEQ